ncbi:MAG: hypothetical protein CMJ78_07015 [Planctomycetaceae bacterium]|nr:hypothetical protein [Planctomycetaceae bacterium]
MTERFVIDLLRDAQQIADATGVCFEVLPYHQATPKSDHVEIRAINADTRTKLLSPPIIINATGAWGDWTLKQLNAESRRLFGGTKGSHFYTLKEELRSAISDDGVYAEAADGRLVFILPLHKGTLIGTTDVPFKDRPENAIADRDEVDYLIEMVNDVVDIQLNRSDVLMTYSGVRPLPYVSSSTTASIPRGHWIESHDDLPMLTLIGGKLTTCRALAEEVCDVVLRRTGQTRRESTFDRRLPGAIDILDDAGVAMELERLSQDYDVSIGQTTYMWQLFGSLTESILEQLKSEDSDRRVIDGLPISRGLVKWIFQHEWVTKLSDLVERRLLLIFETQLTRGALVDLANCLVECGRLNADNVENAVDDCIERLGQTYSYQVK